tara:strand:- start:205 stop:345 length:141 start_codon:yes stop_codon:yes gene_type:complete
MAKTNDKPKKENKKAPKLTAKEKRLKKLALKREKKLKKKKKKGPRS